MLKRLSIRTGLLLLLAVMAFLLLVVSSLGLYALQHSSSSLERMNNLQSGQIARMNEGYISLLRARSEAGQAVRQMEIGLLDDAQATLRNIEIGVMRARQEITEEILSGAEGDDEIGKQLQSSLIGDYNTFMAEGIEPMLSALRKNDVDDYYKLLEKDLIPLGKRLDDSVQAFQSWGNQRGNHDVAEIQWQKNIVLGLIILVAAIAAMVIVIGLLALHHLLLKPLNNAISQLEFMAQGDLTQSLPPA